MLAPIGWAQASTEGKEPPKEAPNEAPREQAKDESSLDRVLREGFSGEIPGKELDVDLGDDNDLVLRTISPGDEDILTKIETEADGRLRAIFPNPITLSQRAAPFHLHADGLVIWVKKRTGATTGGAIETLQALTTSIQEMEIYAEGHVWLSFGKEAQNFTTRASRAFLTISNSEPDESGKVTSTLRGIFDDVSAYTHLSTEKEEVDKEGIGIGGDDPGSSTKGKVNKGAATGDIEVENTDRRLFALERGDRIFLKASRMRLRDINNRAGTRTDILLEEPIASHSSLAIPSFSFRAKQMRIQLTPTRNIASLEGPSLWARSTRLFTYPSENYQHDLDSHFPVKRFSYSTSDSFGHSLRTKVNIIDAYDYLVDPDPTFRPFALSPEFDYFSERGLGYGLEGEYDRLRPFEPGFRTWVHGYFIRDDGDDREIARDLGFFPLRRSDRGRVRGYAQGRIAGGFQIDGHVNYLSDRTFLQEFYDEEFDRNDQERTFLRLSHQWNGRGFYVNTDVRARDYIDEVESLPVMGFVTHREAVGPPGLGLQLSANAELGLYRLHLDDSGHPNNEEQIVRTHMESRLNRPIDFGTVLVDPYVGMRMNAADHRFVAGATPNQLFDEAQGFRAPAADARLESDPIAKAHFLFGASVQTNFSRVYSGVNSEYLGLDGLRHTVTPSVRWENAIGPNGREYDFVQMDKYDADRNMNRVVLSLRNRFQTRRKVKGVVGNVDFADLLFELPLYPNSERDNGGQQFGDLEIQGRFRPHPSLAFDIGGFFEPTHLDWTRWYLALHTAVARTDLTLFFRALRNEHEIVGFATETRFNSTYSVGVEYEYDIRGGKTRDAALRISRTFFETFSFHFKIRRDAIREDLHFSLGLSANFGPANYQPGQ